MAKIRFTDKLGLNQKSQEQLSIVNDIAEEYKEQGYRLTLRQLYYQLVSRDIIPNQQKEYTKLSRLLKQGRMFGVVDWDIIEDRTRSPKRPYWVIGVDDAIQDTINQYRLNRLGNQDCYIEVWVEKDALSGVLSRTTEHYHINLMVNKGYSSCSAMYESSKRFNANKDKDCYILYLGDHDPSGIDMVRDIRGRLEEFGSDVTVLPIALTQKQIAKYNPPPNPMKFSDPRGTDYEKKFGKVCWEVDALTPQVLNTLIKSNVEKLIDIDLFEEKLEEEKEDIKLLKEFRDKNKSDGDEN